MEIANLTKKEQQIRDLIASCYSDSEIAKELKIELTTIATHKNHIFQKLLIFGKHRRLELIKQEMQQLKTEKDELKKQIKSCKECAEQLGKHKVAEQCLDEIEKIINFIFSIKNCDNAYYCKDKLDEILELIKQAKEIYDNN